MWIEPRLLIDYIVRDKSYFKNPQISTLPRSKTNLERCEKTNIIAETEKCQVTKLNLTTLLSNIRGKVCIVYKQIFLPFFNRDWKDKESKK